MRTEEMERAHILHKVVFDVFNERLDKMRIFGTKGVPLTFTLKSKSPSEIEPAQCGEFLG